MGNGFFIRFLLLMRTKYCSLILLLDLLVPLVESWRLMDWSFLHQSKRIRSTYEANNITVTENIIECIMLHGLLELCLFPEWLTSVVAKNYFYQCDDASNLNHIFSVCLLVDSNILLALLKLYNQYVWEISCKISEAV